MTGTEAVPSSWLDESHSWAGNGLPLCPSCGTGYLHPFRVRISLTSRVSGLSWAGVSMLTGWVATCVGNRSANAAFRRLYEQAAAEAAAAGDEGGVDYLAPQDLVDTDACGFSMPMQAG